MSGSTDSLAVARPWSNRALFVILLAGPMLACVLFGAVDSGTWALVAIVTGIGAILWAHSVWRAKEFTFKTSPLLVIAAAFVGLGIFQILAGTSLDPYATRLFTFRLGVYFLFFAAAFYVLNDERRLALARSSIVLFGAGIAFFSILQRLAAPQAIFGLRETPQSIPFGPFVNQHHFAAFMVMVCGLSIASVFATASSQRTRIINIAVTLLAGTAMVMTFSRGAWFSAFIVLIVVVAGTFLARKDLSAENAGRKKYLVPILSCLLLVASVLGLAIFLGVDGSSLSLAGHGSDAEGFSSGRTHFWSVALQIFSHHPIVGAGLDAFPVAYTAMDTSDGTFRVERAHNDYLQILADGGIVGGILVAGFLFFFFREAIGNFRRASRSRRALVLGAAAGCVGIFVHSTVDFPLRTPSNAFFFLLLVVLATLDPENTRSTRRTLDSNLEV